MAGAGKIPSDAGKIRQSERNRTNDDAAFKRADQKISAQNAEREQKRRAFVFQRPADYVGSRAHERSENPEAFTGQGSSDDLAGRNNSSAISETEASMAGYNERRQRTQAAKTEKLAETEQRDLEIKLDQAQYEITNMQPRTQASRNRQSMSEENTQNEPQASAGQSWQITPKEIIYNQSQAHNKQNQQSTSELHEEAANSPIISSYAVNAPVSNRSVKEKNIPNGSSDIEFSVPTKQDNGVVRAPGQAAVLAKTPSQNDGIKIIERDPGFREDALIVEQPHNQPQTKLNQSISGNASQISPEKATAKDATSKDDYETPLESSRKSIQPNFFPSIFGKRSNPTKGKTTRGNSDVLRDAEKTAGDSNSSYGLDAQTGENEVDSDFVNNVGAQKAQEKADGKKAKAGFLKKKGPLLTIIISLLFGGGGMYMTQASLPFTILDKLNDSFDSQDVSVNKRSSIFTRLMAKNAKNIDMTSGATKKNIFGKQKFSVSKKMRKRMKANNLNIITDKSNPNVGKLEFTDKNGQTKIYSPAEFESAYRGDAEIRKAYDTAAHPWKTSVSNFLDKGFKKIMTKFGLKKRALDGYDAKADPTGEKAQKSLANEVEHTFDDGANNKRASGGENDDESMLKSDPDENKATTPSEEVSNNKKKAKNVSAKLKAALGTAFQISQLVCMVPTIMTGATLIAQAYQLYQVAKIAMLFMSGVDQARAGDAASSPINALGRALVEQGAETRYVSTVEAKSSYEKENNDYGYYSYDVKETFNSTETDAHSAIQSEGMSKLFTGDPISEADESIKSFNSENVLKGKLQEIENNIESNLGVLGTLLDDFDAATFLTDEALKSSTFYACQVARMSLAYAMLGLDVAMLVVSAEAAAAGASTGFASGAGFCAATVVLAEAAPVCGAIGGIIGGIVGFFFGEGSKKVIKTVIKMAISWIGSLVVSWAASHVAGFLVTMLERNAVNKFFGEDLGNAIMSGSHAIMADNHRSSGGLLADKEGYMAMLIHQDAVNAEEAESDRLARSPFDITSQNTFAGQLAATLTPVLWQSDSLLDTVGKFGSTIRNSAKVFMPTVSAYDAAQKADYAKDWTENNCENLASIGVVGDEFCNPYIVTDFDTMFTDDSEDEEIETARNTPYQIIQAVGQSNFVDNIDDTENPKIREGSELADYITYCSERESAFGYADENIAGNYDIQENDIWSMIDIVSDIRDAHSGDNILGHFGWIDGSNCVIHENLDYSNALSYDKIRNFSRYMEDQRLAESMGVIEESAVSIFLDEYYEKHPKDMSTKAVLARMSGMTEETFDSIMAGIEVVDFIAHYDPADYYPTPAVHKEDPSYTIEDRDFINDGAVLAVIYESGVGLGYRQRNFAVA